MRLTTFALAASVAATPAFAGPADTLAANKAATGNWNGKKTLKVEYAYSGQGLTGKTSSQEKNIFRLLRSVGCL